jgi:hypothetical protein
MRKVECEIFGQVEEGMRDRAQYWELYVKFTRCIITCTSRTSIRIIDIWLRNMLTPLPNVEKSAE